MPGAHGDPSVVDTATLRETTVLPSLASPLPPGKSAIWCASLAAAWEHLASFLGEPVRLVGADALCTDLNNAPPPSTCLPPGDWYAAAGLPRDGILEEIRREMVTRFPNWAAPELGLAADMPVAFGYLQCFFEFPHAYEDSNEPLPFRGESGRTRPVRSFGVRAEDHDARWELRRQIRVLFGGPLSKGDDYALDLCRYSTSVQVVIARIRKGATLAAMVEEVQARSIVSPPPNVAATFLWGVMLVPNMNWYIRHRFAELSGRPLASSAWAGLPIDVTQEIRFRLDRRGVALASEAQVKTLGGSSGQFVLDEPFLLYLKRRDATTPFFAMWVATTEVLEPFG